MTKFYSAWDGSYRLYLDLTQAELTDADIAANTSRVTYKLGMERKSSNRFNQYRIGRKVTINGVVVANVSRNDSALLGFDSGVYDITITSGSTTIPHNDDGSKTASLSASIDMTADAYAPGAMSLSGSWVLTSIPRASAVTATNANMGAVSVISISRAVDSYTHKLWYQFDGQSEKTLIAEEVGASYEWSVPEVYDLVPASTTLSCTITCDTYMGGTLLGTKTCTMTATVPQSIKPKAEFDVYLINDNAVVAGWGIYLKGFSKLGYDASGSTAGEGATIASYSLTFAGKTLTGEQGTSDLLDTAGTFNPELTVTDTRGRTDTLVLPEIRVYDYSVPTISSSSAFRCNEYGVADTAGAYVNAHITASAASVDGRNTLTVRYRHRSSEGMFGGYTALVNGENKVIDAKLSYTVSYVVELSAIDALGGVKVATVVIPTDAVTFQLIDGGGGASFGEYSSEKNMLNVAKDWNVRFKGSLVVEGDVTVVGSFNGSTGGGEIDIATIAKAVALINMPVGYVYVSADPTSPQTLFGGTWVAVEDTFILTAGTKYKAGDTGGVAEVTLTTAQIPAHTHRQTITAGRSGSGETYASWNAGNVFGNTDTAARNTLATGGGEAHTNMPPYKVFYAWQRIA